MAMTGAHTSSVSNFSQCPWKQGLACGESGHNGGPAPCTPLNNGASLPSQSTLPPGAFLAAELLSPIPSGYLRAANSSPLPGSTLLTPRFSTQPTATRIGRHLSQAGAHRALVQTVHASLTLSCLPDEPLHFLPIAPEGPPPPPFPCISPPVRGLPICGNFCSPSVAPQGGGSHPVSFFLFLSFVLPSYAGIFSCPFRCLVLC